MMVTILIFFQTGSKSNLFQPKSKFLQPKSKFLQPTSNLLPTKTSSPLDSILPMKFMIIGERKSGTSSLFTILCEHQQIICSEKEPMYFSRNRNKPIEWYVNKFPKYNFSESLGCYPHIIWKDHKFQTVQKCTKVNPSKTLYTGEGSATYFREADPHEIRLMFPNIKLILMLRNSTSRTISHLKMLKRFGQKFDINERIRNEIQKINLCIQREDGCVINNNVGISIYEPMLAKWRNVFEKDLKVIWLHKLKKQPKRTIRDIFEFLGLDAEEQNLEMGQIENSNGEEGGVNAETFEYLNNFFASLPSQYKTK